MPSNINNFDLTQLFAIQKGAFFNDKTWGSDISGITSVENGNVVTTDGTALVSFQGNVPATEHQFQGFMQTSMDNCAFQYDGTITEVSSQDYIRYEGFNVSPLDGGGSSFSGTAHHGTAPDGADEVTWLFENFSMKTLDNGNVIVNGKITKNPGDSAEIFQFENAEFTKNPDGSVDIVGGKVMDENGATLMEVGKPLEAGMEVMISGALMVVGALVMLGMALQLARASKNLSELKVDEGGRNISPNNNIGSQTRDR